MVIAETERLIISRFTEADAGFIFELMNTPGWLEHIGDRNIRDEASALEYLKSGALKSYIDSGFGGWLLSEKLTGKKVGSAGIYKRDFLEFPDLGYALLPQFEGKGFAFEAAQKIAEIAYPEFKIETLSAITSKGNDKSVGLLEKLGFQKSGEMIWPQTEEVLFLFIRSYQ